MKAANAEFIVPTIGNMPEPEWSANIYYDKGDTHNDRTDCQQFSKYYDFFNWFPIVNISRDNQHNSSGSYSDQKGKIPYVEPCDTESLMSLISPSPS